MIRTIESSEILNILLATISRFAGIALGAPSHSSVIKENPMSYKARLKRPGQSASFEALGESGMNPPLRVNPKLSPSISGAITTLSCVVSMFLLTLAASAQTMHEADPLTEEPEIVFDRAEETGKSTAEKALVCHANGSYCIGGFDDMIFRVRYQNISVGGSTSQTQVWVQPQIRDLLNSTGYCSLFNDVYVVIRDDDPMQQTITRRLDIAMAIGGVFRLNWTPGPSGYCEIWRIFQPY